MEVDNFDEDLSLKGGTKPPADAFKIQLHKSATGIVYWDAEVKASSEIELAQRADAVIDIVQQKIRDHRWKEAGTK